MNKPFTIERTYNAPPDKVWQAISNNAHLQKWYFKLPEFKAEPGFEFSFTGGPKDGRQYVHLCQVKEVIPGKKLSYSWRYEGEPGDSLVTFELFPEGNNTRLKLTHSGLETFDRSNPDMDAKNFEAGWKHIIGTSLDNYLKN
jgi:uncharacterized protein YndB with AHSA1/START domain